MCTGTIIKEHHEFERGYHEKNYREERVDRNDINAILMYEKSQKT